MVRQRSLTWKLTRKVILWVSELCAIPLALLIILLLVPTCGLILLVLISLAIILSLMRLNYALGALTFDHDCSSMTQCSNPMCETAPRKVMGLRNWPGNILVWSGQLMSRWLALARTRLPWTSKK